MTVTRLKYRGAHMRVTKARGRACGHLCVDCGNTASQWSYRHDDPNEIEDEAGRQYSVDPLHYDPRCRRCHIRFDLRHRATELRGIAGPIVLELKFVVYQRDVARRHGDRDGEELWDDELERLMEPLKGRIGLPRRHTCHNLW